MKLSEEIEFVEIICLEMGFKLTSLFQFSAAANISKQINKSLTKELKVLGIECDKSVNN